MSNAILTSRFWDEEADANNPFAAQSCYCSGYDVYGEVLTQATYLEYLFLLFRRERPTRSQTRALEILAIALANPGPRDPSVHAAMGAGVSGSPAAAALIAALAVGAGVSGGAREVRLAMDRWQHCGTNLVTWKAYLHDPPTPTRLEVWPVSDHPPGFDPYGSATAQPVLQILTALAASLPEGAVTWLSVNREALEALAGKPLAMPGIAAAVLIDLGFAPAEGEMLTLLLRLPGAAAHTLEQAEIGFRHFPFFALDIENDPGPATNPRS